MSVQVALKQLTLPDLSKSALTLFEQETSVWAKLSQRKEAPITCLYGICTPPSPCCMVMEYMPQGDLSEVLSQGILSSPNSDANWTLRLQFALDMTEGLHYLHGQAIIHRDLKSMNVLISGDNRARLADFGLSQIKKETTSYLSKTTSAQRGHKRVAGSLLWMAPELLGRRGKYTCESDIYALGVVLWEMTSRRLPYSDADTANESNIRAWIKDGDIDEVPEGTPVPLAKVINDCRALKPKDRPDLKTVLQTLRTLQQERTPTSRAAVAASHASFQPSALSGYALSTAPARDSASNTRSRHHSSASKSGYRLS